MTESAGRSAPLAQAGVDADNPWPGLEAFREADQEFFRGRSLETKELANRVLRERLILLYGLSGLGKTSLLRAGILPRLREAKIFPVYVRLDFSVENPDFSDQVLGAIAAQATDAEIDFPLARGSESLWEYFHRRGAEFWNRRNQPLLPLLVFDQFEEIFTLGRANEIRVAACKSLVVELMDLIEGRPPASLRQRFEAFPEEAAEFVFRRNPCKLLMTLREDYLADFKELSLAGLPVDYYRLHRMNGEAALRVVNQAPQLIDPEVAEKVVRFVAAAKNDQIPLAGLEVEPALLSVICRELNGKRKDGGKITADLLEHNRETVLSDIYERGTVDLAPEVRLFIEDKLLTASGHRDSVAMDNALLFPGIGQSTIDELVKRRLVRVEERGGARRLELIHDRLTDAISASRNQRQQLEAERREVEALRKLRRSRLIAGLFVVLTLLAIALSFWAMGAQLKAETNQLLAEVSQENSERALAREQKALEEKYDAFKKEEVSRLQAVEARIKAQKALARSHLQEFARLSSEDKMGQALAYLARAMKVDPDNSATRAEAVSRLVSQSFPFPQEPIRHQVDFDETDESQWFRRPNVAASFSPDSRWVVTAARDTAQVWEVATGKRVGIAMKHGTEVVAATFSPDSRRIATFSEDKTVQIWDSKTGNRIGAPISSETKVDSATLSLDGQWLALATPGDAVTGGVVKLMPVSGNQDDPPKRYESGLAVAMRPEGPRLLSKLDERTTQVEDVGGAEAEGGKIDHSEEVRSATLSPDGRWAVALLQNGEAQVWEAATGEPWGEKLKNALVFSPVFSPGSEWLATGYPTSGTRPFEMDFRLQISSVREGLEDFFPTDVPLTKPIALSFSSSGERLLISQADPPTTILYLLDRNRSSLTALAQFPGASSASFSPDGQWVLTVAGNHKEARFWNSKDGRSVGAPIFHHGLWSASFSPNGQRIMTTSQDGTVQLWAVPGEHVAMPLHLAVDAFPASFSPDSRWLVAAAANEASFVIRVWDAGTGKPTGPRFSLDGSTVSASFSPDGRSLLTSDLDVTQVWDLQSGEKISSIGKADSTGTEEEIVKVVDRKWGSSFSPDGRSVVTTVRGRMQVWNPLNGKPIGRPIDDFIETASFSPNSQRLVAIYGHERTAKILDPNTGELVGRPMSLDAVIDFATFSPDGLRVITISRYDRADLWDANTGKRLSSPISDKAGIDSASFSPDGKWVVTASSDKQVQIWETATGRPVGEPIQPKNSVASAVFSPDGQRVLSIAWDALQIWEALSSRPLTEPLKPCDGPEPASFSPDGQRVVRTCNDGTVRILDTPTYSAAEAETLAELTEVVGGFRVTELGKLERIPLSERRTRLKALRRIGDGAKDNEPEVASFIRWYLKPRFERSISPLSKMTVEQYLDELRALGTVESWRQAVETFSGHPHLPQEPWFDPEE